MRDFTRMFLRVAMFIFLLVGCGYNISYMKEIAELNHQANMERQYNPYRYNYDDNIQTYEEEKDTVETTEIEEDYQDPRTINYPY